MTTGKFEERLTQHRGVFAPVVPLAPGDKLLRMDFTAANTELTDEILKDTDLFSQWVDRKLSGAGARYGVGGYDEHRTVYSRSHVFAGSGAEPRRLHLGIDIWGPAGTPVSAPLDGTVHSFANNDSFGDYGATIILRHQLEGESFYVLYGHLNLASLARLREGQVVKAGEVFCSFGLPQENGQWPPHLHFQLILDMQGWKGDYPGVCAFSERGAYLPNCPNPDLILGMMEGAAAE